MKSPPALQTESDRDVVIAKIMKLVENVVISLTEADFKADEGEFDDAELAEATRGWKNAFAGKEVEQGIRTEKPVPALRRGRIP